MSRRTLINGACAITCTRRTLRTSGPGRSSIGGCYWKTSTKSTVNGYTSLARDQSTVATEPQDGKSRSLKAMLSLQDKVTVVTGGGRGIGLALAGIASELGSHVAVIDTLEKPYPNFERLSENGTKVKYYRSDVTKPEVLEQTFEGIAAELGSIDKCVTAAGIVLEKPFMKHGWEESQRILNVNVLGTFFSAQFAAKHMMSQRTGGSIVMIASVASHCAIPSQRLPIYGASKGAVRILARHLAVELAQHKIRVNTISPGYIATDMTKNLGIEFPELISVFKSASPMKRMGEPTDLTGVAAYLLSDASAYTTGADVRVDGALAAGRL